MYHSTQLKMESIPPHLGFNFSQDGRGSSVPTLLLYSYLLKAWQLWGNSATSWRLNFLRHMLWWTQVSMRRACGSQGESVPHAFMWIKSSLCRDACWAWLGQCPWLSWTEKNLLPECMHPHPHHQIIELVPPGLKQPVCYTEIGN